MAFSFSLKKIKFCNQCKFADLKNTDAEKFAPCCVNPPDVSFEQKSKAWYSGRPLVMLAAPACRFAKKK